MHDRLRADDLNARYFGNRFEALIVDRHDLRFLGHDIECEERVFCSDRVMKIFLQTETEGYEKKNRADADGNTKDGEEKTRSLDLDILCA